MWVWEPDTVCWKIECWYNFMRKMCLLGVYQLSISNANPFVDFYKRLHWQQQTAARRGRKTAFIHFRMPFLLFANNNHTQRIAANRKHKITFAKLAFIYFHGWNCILGVTVARFYRWWFCWLFISVLRTAYTYFQCTLSYVVWCFS